MKGKIRKKINFSKIIFYEKNTFYVKDSIKNCTYANDK